MNRMQAVVAVVVTAVPAIAIDYCIWFSLSFSKAKINVCFDRKIESKTFIAFDVEEKEEEY